MIHNDPMDLYRALGLSPSATSEEIAAAFRKRAKETHPDSTGQASADAFREVSDAYDILGDPVRRQEYDAAARELYEQQQASAEAAERAKWRAADPSPSQAVRSRMRRAIAIVWILVCCNIGVWVTLEERAKGKAEFAYAQERDADISRRFPTCANPPESESYLGPDGQPSGTHEFKAYFGPSGQSNGTHSIWIRNETLYNMIVKVRDVRSGHVIASFFSPNHCLL